MKLCFHDWEIVEQTGEDELKQWVKSVFWKVPYMGHALYDRPYYNKKVCLKCGKFVDEISPKVTKFKKEIQREKDRKEKAKKLFDEASAKLEDSIPSEQEDTE